MSMRELRLPSQYQDRSPDVYQCGIGIVHCPLVFIGPRPRRLVSFGTASLKTAARLLLGGVSDAGGQASNLGFTWLAIGTAAPSALRFRNISKQFLGNATQDHYCVMALWAIRLQPVPPPACNFELAWIQRLANSTTIVAGTNLIWMRCGVI